MNVRRRALLVWGAIGLIGFGFAVGPLFTHGDLSRPHIAAHALTGPLLVTLAVWQSMAARRRRSRRGVDFLLCAIGVWLAVLPFALPAPGLHVPAHVSSGLLVAAGSLWNALRPPAGAPGDSPGSGDP
jgi:hypothetical protein